MKTSKEVGRLAEALTRAVRDAAVAGPPVTVLYSGGLDSSLVAHLVPSPPGCRLKVVGLKGARDRLAAEEGARLLGLELISIELTVDDVRKVVQEPEWEVRGAAEPSRSVRASIGLALARCPGERVLLGQGADELFYGYAHFADLDPASSRARSAQDLAVLLDSEWPWTERTAKRLGTEVHAPFLDPRVVAAAGALPPPDPGCGEVPKQHLRTAARLLGLPETLVDRPKRAMQYGSGVARAVARLL